MSHVALVKIAPVFETELVLDPNLIRPGRTLYQRGSLTLRGEAHVLVNHDRQRPIGHVDKLVEFDDVDGCWIAALTTIDKPPCWLERGVRASFAIATVERHMIGDTERVLRGLVSEISVLSPGVRPAEACAQVVTFHESKPAAGEQVSYAPTVIRRPGSGRVLAVR